MIIFFLGIIIVTVIALFYLRYLSLFLLIPIKYNSAKRSLEIGNETLAIKQLTQILTIDRGNAAVNWLLAQIYIKKKQPIMAEMYLYEIIHYAKYIREINETMVRETLAFLYQKSGDFNKAIIQYSLLKNQNKLTPESMKNAILVALENNNYKQIEFLLNIIKSLNFHDGEFDYYNALVDFHHDRFLAAQQKLKMAVEKGYKDFTVDFLMGKILFFSRKYKQALKYFENLSYDYLNDAELESFMGQCFYYLKDYKTTIEIIEKLLESTDRKKNKFIINMEYILGCAYESSGNIDRALQIYQNIKNYVSSFQPVIEKLNFYKNIDKEPEFRNLMFINTQSFVEQTEEFIESKNFYIKQKIFKDEKNLEYLCGANQDSNFLNLHYFYITRNSQPFTIKLLNELQIKAKQYKTRNLNVVAFHFNEDVLNFANRNNITTYTFKDFKK